MKKLRESGLHPVPKNRTEIEMDAMIDVLDDGIELLPKNDFNVDIVLQKLHSSPKIKDWGKDEWDWLKWALHSWEASWAPKDRTMLEQLALLNR
jgi:hypothetical protein